MYTQCSHCKAIFRVTMKELTTAQGLLRCGECNNTFDAMESLSSTLHSSDPSYKKEEIKEPAIREQLRQTGHGHNLANSNTKTYSSAEDSAQRFILFAVIGLAFLLLFQVLYSYRDWLAHNPVTGDTTRAICDAIDCGITPKRDPANIKIISRNVYAHPNENGALVIAASMKNQAPFNQPYPLVEVSFLNAKGETVALKRFPPNTYLKTSSQTSNEDNGGSDTLKENEKLFLKNDTFNFKLKIADPGDTAVRFQFRFL